MTLLRPLTALAALAALALLPACFGTRPPADDAIGAAPAVPTTLFITRSGAERLLGGSLDGLPVGAAGRTAGGVPAVSAARSLPARRSDGPTV